MPAIAARNTNHNLVRIFAACLGTLLFFYAVLWTRELFERETLDAVTILMMLGRLALGAAGFVMVVRPARLAQWLERQIDRMGKAFEAGYAATATQDKIMLIVLVTMLSLLLELVMIRWMASVFPVFSHYKNFTLLACFLGLGAGYAVANRQPCAPALVLPMLSLFIVVMLLLRYDLGSYHELFTTHPMREQSSMQMTMARFDWLTYVHLSIPLYLLLSTSFIICACICYPIGQLCGKLMGAAKPLKAYGLNLIGSVLGVAALFVMSLFWLPPVVWFAAAGGVLLYCVLSRDKSLPLGIASFCLMLVALSWPVQPEAQRIYSPYQLLERTAKPDGMMMILSGGSYYQKVFDLSDGKRGHESKEDRYVRAYYEFPFSFKKKPERVAIVGSGSGNDVAAALRMGASHVDAIEIDPAIAHFGKHYHPERPYSDPRVNLIVNDARNFFRTAQGRYDLIVYGVLDSHTALSHASNLRVDSYVYTREGIAEAFKLLKPDGVMSIAFALPNDSLGFKLSHILSDLPGAGKPLAVRVLYDAQSTTAFVTRKGGDVALPNADAYAAIGFTDISSHFARAYPASSIPTDDWPFFYMIERTYPVTYLFALGMVLLLSFFFARRIVGLGGPVEHGYVPFFFLGAGFMLVETKAITELGLHLGGTWFVIAATIVLVLVMAYLANVLVQRRRMQWPGLAYVGLIASLLVGYAYARDHGLIGFTSPLVAATIAGILLTVPLFFSGLIFSSLIARPRINVSTALAYNLMGALFGGLMEYNSMYFGFAFLYLLAIVFYGMAWLFSVDLGKVPLTQRAYAVARSWLF